MKRKLRTAIILFFIAVNCFAFEQSFEPQNGLTVGDKAVLKIKADGLTSESLDKNKLATLNFGDFELLDVKQGDAGEVDFVLSCYKAGKVELLSVDISYTVNGQSKFVKTEAVQAEIKSVLDPKKPNRDILDIKGITPFGHGAWWYLKFVIAALLILLLAYLAYRFIKNKKRKPTREEIIRSVPPKEYALSQLEDLKTLGLAEKGLVKDYYDKLSDILRFYVSRVYNVDGMEKTTGELFLLLKNKAPSDYNRELKDYLINCDFVKFAKVVPSGGDIEDDFKKAKNFVERI